MKNDFIKNNLHHGFIALTATMTVIAVVLTFSFIVLSSAYVFSDSVFRKELRIQTGLNLVACLNYSKYLYANNFFIDGQVYIRELGCNLIILNDFEGNMTVYATTTLSGISSDAEQRLHNDNFVVKEFE